MREAVSAPGANPTGGRRRRVLALAARGGALPESGLELLGAASRLDGAETAAVVLADDEAAGRRAAALLPAAEALVLVGPPGALATAEGAASALHRAAEETDADLVLLPHDSFGWDAAPLLAARCGGAAATACTALRFGPEGLEAERRVFSGKFVQEVRLDGRPAVATVEPGAFPPLEPGPPGAVRAEEAAAPPGGLLSRLVEIRDAPGGEADLPAARVVVAAGRGIGGPENLPLLEELAAALGGVVGASRAVTDAGWLPHDRQIGSSGVTVNPKLYVACGISGAIQHLVGMRGSGFVAAINKDAEAPIFEAADVGIVGDVLEVVPALTRAVREAPAG